MGPLQLPLADVAVVAQSHQDLSGAATSIGEQPLKGLISPPAMARLALGEAITNLCFARATGLSDVKASVNWMYAAKMGSEGAAMYEAATALRCALVVCFCCGGLPPGGRGWDGEGGRLPAPRRVRRAACACRLLRALHTRTAPPPAQPCCRDEMIQLNKPVLLLNKTLTRSLVLQTEQQTAVVVALLFARVNSWFFGGLGFCVLGRVHACARRCS